jgi:hypothetical protein
MKYRHTRSGVDGNDRGARRIVQDAPRAKVHLKVVRYVGNLSPVCIRIYVSVCVCAYMSYVWMDGWMDACMHACTYARYLKLRAVVSKPV